MNKIKDEIKVHAFLSVIGPKAHGLLKHLTASVKPSELALEQTDRILAQQLDAKGVSDRGAC